MIFKQHCENHKLYNSTTEFILKDQICIPNKKVIEIPVPCPQNIITKVGKCNNNDDKIITKYKFFNRNCKCVKEKIEEYSCKCKCPKESTTYSCNTFLKVQTKTVVKNLLCQCKCVEKVKATRKTITCPEEKIVISSCKEVSGKDHGIRTTRRTKYEINNQCKCVPKDYLEEEICCCKRNEIVKSTCNKINHVMTITKSYTIFRNKQCQRNTEIVKKCVCCGSGKWSLKEESKCIPDNSYGNKVLTYVRQINDGCTCKEEVKQKKCHCICEGPPLKQLCENNRIKRIRYSYSIVKCKCVVKEEEISYKNIECNKLLPIKKPCHQDVDGVYRNSTIYRERKVEQCKCLTTERKESCVCKCKRSVTVKTCENNMFIFTKNWYKRTCKGCLTQIKKRSEPILCAPSLVCNIVKKCNGRKKDKQIHECIRKTLQNCKCVETKERMEAKCWCRKPIIRKGLCNKSSCTREITTVTSNLIIGRYNERKCEDVTSIKKEKCCCLEKPTVTVECKNNVLKKTTVKYHFVETCKSCSKTVNIINITPSCLPAKFVAKSTCSIKNCVQCETVTRKSLVNCQCQTSSETYCIKCRENFSVKKCKPDNNFKITCHKFTLNKRKCSEKITSETKLTTCPETKSQYLTTCNIVKRTRILETTSYRKFNCACLAVIVTKDKICMCLPPSTKEQCIAKSGITRRKYISYTLDTIKNECISNLKTTDIPTNCNTKSVVNCGVCKVSYHGGMYKKCITTFSVRQGCKCIFRSNIHFKLCNCPKKQNSNICIDNDTSGMKNTYYVQVKSKSNCYDIECSKKTKNVNMKKIQCLPSKITKGACIVNTQIYIETYYTINSCKCITQTKSYTVRCRCPDSKEIKRKCMFQSRWDKSIRSYKLVCNKQKIPKCTCEHIDQVHMESLQCPSLTYVVGPCSQNKRKITYTEHKSVNCKCQPSQRSEYINCECKCKGIKTEMADCKKIKEMGQCNHDLYLKYLCRYTCGWCEKCPKCSNKIIGPCKCKKVAGINLCSRNTIITNYIIINRKSVKRESLQQSLCGCTLDSSREKCEQLKKEGRCKDVKIVKRCEFICSDICQSCQGIFKRVKCINRGQYKGKNRIVTISFNKRCGSCFTETKVTYENALAPCEIHRRIYVTDCIHNIRFVVTNYVSGKTGVYKTKRKSYSCKDCCSSTETKIGECSNGYRTVLTVFWADINQCCRKQTITNVYSCNPRCNTISYSHSQCINNKKIVGKMWKSGENCESFTASEIKSCIPILT